MFKKNLFLFEANAGGGGGAQPGAGSNQQNVNGNSGGGDGSQPGGEGSTQPALTFEAWQEKLPQDQKDLVDGHVKGLKTALTSERESRKDLEKQVRDLAKKAEAGSEQQTQLTKLADDLQSADRKADFYEEAHGAGVKNLKLAYTVAVTDEMFDKRGRVNFEEMKKTYPELFGSTSSNTPRGNAGAGGNVNQTESMDDFIRSKIK